MIFKPLLTILLCLFTLSSFAQVKSIDSTNKLNEINVKGYYNRHPLLRSVNAVSLIDSTQINNQNDASLVGLINTATGVRMEERSPGSYRFSLRGSLLRSPFGIRNIKIYVNDFPLTDAGGNTYLNLIDIKSIAAIEIYKGPEASAFGANTGGAVLISANSLTKNNIELGSTVGSYGLFKQYASISQVYKKYQISITQGYQKSDGYRQNSALKRNFMQSTQQWEYNTKGKLNALIFVSDLAYETPGGLTAEQMNQNPQAARPSTTSLPGAITQKAGIYNKTIFGGISHSYQFNSNLKHVATVFASYTDFKNPFITNYEKRYENTSGLRTFLDFSIDKADLNLNAQLGVESSSTKSKINNFKNNAGEATSLQAKDDLSANQRFAFLKINIDFKQRLLVELSSSLNFFKYSYESYFPLWIGQKQKTFTNQLMPKIAASYLISPAISLRTSASKGYSPPTLAEVRSSDNLINIDLQPEYGWNYELGLRLKTSTNRFYANVNAFSYHLKEAIVRRLNQNDTEYFLNAGGTKQQGIEIEATGWLIPTQTTNVLSGLQVRSGYTYSQFKFQDFTNGTANFSGNKLTGVPDHVFINSAELTFKKNLFVFIQHNYTSTIPLNDANTAKAKAYHLTEIKAGLRNVQIRRTKVELFSGINNLFNSNYSLGNDLNAANARYFNPSAKINFYFGFVVKL